MSAVSQTRPTFADSNGNDQFQDLSTQSSTTTLGDGPAKDEGSATLPLLSTIAQLSACLTTLGEQIATTSHHVLPTQPTTASVELEPLVSRLEAVQATQVELESELAALKAQIEPLQNATQVSADMGQLEKKLEDVLTEIKLDQSRLYPRLHNATVTVSKMPIKPLATANGKFPPNFPATKGEFEHLTKERYEDIMKAYGLPIKGDTSAKREALRVFIGLPA